MGIIASIWANSSAIRHPHSFQEIVELSEGDEIAIAELQYGGNSWAEQLHIENRSVEFDTRMGHLSFIVLYSECRD